MINPLDAPLNKDSLISEAQHVIAMMKQDIALLERRLKDVEFGGEKQLQALADDLHDISTSTYAE